MTKGQRSGVSVVAALIFALAGCTSVYRATTVLHSDGSVERSILQPASALGADAAKAEAWTSLEVRAEQPPGASRAEMYVTARGRFPSPEKIPDHVVVKLENGEAQGLPEARLARKYVRNDYVVVTEHVWRETLEDVVTLQGMRRARDELVELGADLTRDVLAETIGREYDAAPLVKWIRGEGKQWAADLSDYLFAAWQATPPPANRQARDEHVTRIMKGIEGVCLRHGMQPEPGGALNFTEEFTVALVSRHVIRRRDRKPVNPALVRAWLAELNDDDLPAGATPVGFLAAFEKVVAQKYGGKAAFDKRTAPLLVAVMGVHWSKGQGVFQCEYAYDLSVPGVIVETNGQRRGENGTRWEFLDKDAWPGGFVMSCRSLEPQAALQKKLLGGKAVASREAMEAFVALMKSSAGATGTGGLLPVLRKCRDGGSMMPLDDYRAALVRDSRRAELERVDRLRELFAEARE